MIFVDGWTTARAINGDEIRVKIIPLKRKQNNSFGASWVEVGKQIEFESGEKCALNLDGKSFYFGLNKLYKLKSLSFNK
ncbi:transposase [Acinetobacter zhairhuonensis]|uniref:transposase n=1 Tax=Acinetobacter sp. A7.4 TaxID=2919921 RepID=UPI001F4E9A2E|nr:transposase [Acinetobacter sp. A7.4]MCJ8160763.1 transposase [Acinetobacter sp. A7.4]